MTAVAGATQQQEYEDDFEKDLDWLISEEAKGDEQQHEEDFEAQIDRELSSDGTEEIAPKEGDEEGGVAHDGGEERGTAHNGDEEMGVAYIGDEGRGVAHIGDEEKGAAHNGNEERGVAHHGDEERGAACDGDEEAGADKQSILEKIERANRQLRDQEAPDATRRRRLHFKDNPVVPVAPVGATGGRVLVERDGKFDLVNIREVAGQGLLPPLPAPRTDAPGKSPSSSSASSSSGPEPGFVPRPPPPPWARLRPDSAGQARRRGLGRGGGRRVQSAGGDPSHPTHSLSAGQKERLSKQQEKRERLAREEEERRQDEEEQKRQENEQAFRAWLLKKRRQLQEGRRVQRAQEMELRGGKRECCDPTEAYKLWLQKKQEQQLKERQLEEMRRLELEGGVYLHRPEECEKAFRLWLKKKRLEKRAEQRAARERTRMLLMEERRARRLQDVYYPVDEVRSLRLSRP